MNLKRGMKMKAILRECKTTKIVMAAVDAARWTAAKDADGTKTKRMLEFAVMEHESGLYPQARSSANFVLKNQAFNRKQLLGWGYNV